MLLYLRQRWRGLLFGLLAVLLFSLSFSLYHLPLASVLYPAALCAALALLLLLFDIFRVRRKCRTLRRGACLPEELPARLPPVTGPEEAAYQEILCGLSERLLTERRENERRYAEMVDYFTLWAHQIKIPISAMDVALQQEDSPAARHYKNELFRIRQYVEMVLVFLQLDTGSRDYVIERCDLDGILRAAVKKFSGEFIGRRLRLRYAPLDYSVVTDAKWLCFVVEQLLSNALKYTREGEISLTMPQPGLLCVQDTGMGIAPEDLPRIFERGYTGYHGRTDRRASGIGLYLCRRICDNLGHGIHAQSVPEQGTCITLDLRRRPTGETADILQNC